MTVETRYITTEDIAGLNACVDQVARERRWLGSFEGFPLAATRAFVQRMIEHDNPQYVAVDEGRVVGWIDITPSGSEIARHVGTLGMGLLKLYRGQGLGRQLMHTALAKARAKRLKRVELDVFSHNTAAITLYRKIGFQHEGIRKRAAKLDDGYTDIVMMGLWLEDED